MTPDSNSRTAAASVGVVTVILVHASVWAGQGDNHEFE
jgi:hypothetical protein